MATAMLPREGNVIKLGTRRNDGAPLIILGLSENNLEQLRKGRPIPIQFGEIGVPGDGEIVIMWGQTEKAIMQEIQTVLGAPLLDLAIAGADEAAKRGRKS